MADLYFWASKLIGFFLEPLHALGLLTALTLVTLTRRRPRARIFRGSAAAGAVRAGGLYAE